MAKIIDSKKRDEGNHKPKTLSRRDKRRMMEERWSKVQHRRRILGIIPEMK